MEEEKERNEAGGKRTVRLNGKKGEEVRAEEGKKLGEEEIKERESWRGKEFGGGEGWGERGRENKIEGGGWVENERRKKVIEGCKYKKRQGVSEIEKRGESYEE